MMVCVGPAHLEHVAICRRAARPCTCRRAMALCISSLSAAVTLWSPAHWVLQLQQPDIRAHCQDTPTSTGSCTGLHGLRSPAAHKLRHLVRDKARDRLLESAVSPLCCHVLQHRSQRLDTLCRSNLQSRKHSLDDAQTFCRKRKRCGPVDRKPQHLSQVINGISLTCKVWSSPGSLAMSKPARATSNGRTSTNPVAGGDATATWTDLLGESGCCLCGPVQLLNVIIAVVWTSVPH